MANDPILVGRSSSHFTRTARIFALELGVPHTFRAVLDLTTVDPAAYAGNPALKVPILVDEQGPLFGTENICRELARRSGRSGAILRGDCDDRLVANAEELVLHGMGAGVNIITAGLAGPGQAAPPKVRQSLENVLAHLEVNLEGVLAALPPARSLSFLETTLFCLLTHLPFRKVMEVTGYPRLLAFASAFGERPGARSTEYCFDATRVQ
jgi:glutathione S-transferase